VQIHDLTNSGTVQSVCPHAGSGVVESMLGIEIPRFPQRTEQLRHPRQRRALPVAGRSAPSWSWRRDALGVTRLQQRPPRSDRRMAGGDAGAAVRIRGRPSMASMPRRASRCLAASNRSRASISLSCRSRCATTITARSAIRRCRRFGPLAPDQRRAGLPRHVVGVVQRAALFDLYGPVTAGFTSAININRYDSSGNPLNTTTGSRRIVRSPAPTQADPRPIP